MSPPTAADTNRGHTPLRVLVPARAQVPAGSSTDTPGSNPAGGALTHAAWNVATSASNQGRYSDSATLSTASELA